ncbi:hypothetical protein FB45DRAFT_1012233 [Roridomyces roridus]|uniref:Uncharacterized protein n=1 Tax=Roridomyces roridus TaxID=1738132 RepID=A0AAD7AZU9_9AGAR|nr:hypothetical protein FB45DRAFT_1012233 [Roridomyces roridus]
MTGRRMDEEGMNQVSPRPRPQTVNSTPIRHSSADNSRERLTMAAWPSTLCPCLVRCPRGSRQQKRLDDGMKEEEGSAPAAGAEKVARGVVVVGCGEQELKLTHLSFQSLLTHRATVSRRAVETSTKAQETRLRVSERLWGVTERGFLAVEAQVCRNARNAGGDKVASPLDSLWVRCGAYVTDGHALEGETGQGGGGEVSRWQCTWSSLLGDDVDWVAPAKGARLQTDYIQFALSQYLDNTWKYIYQNLKPQADSEDPQYKVKDEEQMAYKREEKNRTAAAGIERGTRTLSHTATRPQSRLLNPHSDPQNPLSESSDSLAMVLATGGRAIWCPNSQWELPRLPPMQNPPATTHFMNPAAYGSYYTGGYYPAPMAGYPAPMTPGPSTPTYCAATYSQIHVIQLGLTRSPLDSTRLIELDRVGDIGSPQLASTATLPGLKAEIMSVRKKRSSASRLESLQVTPRIKLGIFDQFQVTNDDGSQMDRKRHPGPYQQRWPSTWMALLPASHHTPSSTRTSSAVARSRALRGPRADGSDPFVASTNPSLIRNAKILVNLMGTVFAPGLTTFGSDLRLTFDYGREGFDLLTMVVTGNLGALQHPWNADSSIICRTGMEFSTGVWRFQSDDDDADLFPLPSASSSTPATSPAGSDTSVHRLVNVKGSPRAPGLLPAALAGARAGSGSGTPYSREGVQEGMRCRSRSEAVCVALGSGAGRGRREQQEEDGEDGWVEVASSDQEKPLPIIPPLAASVLAAGPYSPALAPRVTTQQASLAAAAGHGQGHLRVSSAPEATESVLSTSPSTSTLPLKPTPAAVSSTRAPSPSAGLGRVPRLTRTRAGRLAPPSHLVVYNSHIHPPLAFFLLLHFLARAYFESRTSTTTSSYGSGLDLEFSCLDLTLFWHAESAWHFLDLVIHNWYLLGRIMLVSAWSASAQIRSVTNLLREDPFDSGQATE